MALAPSSDNVMLGSGELFFARFSAAGVRDAYHHFGNCERFAIIPNVDFLSLNTSMDAGRGLYKRVARSVELNVEISSHEYALAGLAMALMGEESTFTQSLATTTATLTPAPVLGRFYKVAARNITGVSITQGTVTWAASTDYTIYDASAGVIQVKEAASTAVATASPAVIIYTAATTSLSMIIGGTKTKIEGSLLFVPDPTTGPQYDVEIWRCAVNPTGEVSLIGNEFGQYTLQLAALNDAIGSYGGSAAQPYFRMIQRGTA